MLRITDTEIISDLTGERARRGDDGRWYATNRPGQALDRNGAITAMTLAEECVRECPDVLLIADLRRELDELDAGRDGGR